MSGAGWIPEAGDTFVPDVHARGAIGYQHAFAPSEFARECEAAGLAVLSDECSTTGAITTRPPSAADSRPTSRDPPESPRARRAASRARADTTAT